MPVPDTLARPANGFRRILLLRRNPHICELTDPSPTLEGTFENPELTIAAGLFTLGVATYLAPSLLLDGEDPAALVAVFGAFSLVYLAVFILLHHVPSVVRETL